MATIYYRDPQTNNFIPITYKDFNAASIWHTHTWNDIKVYKYDKNNLNTKEEIPQTLSILDGGANIEPSSNKNSSSGIYSINIQNSSIKQIFAKSGVLGYFNGANNYPEFDTWPIINGGTGAKSQKEVQQNFQITAPKIINLDYRYTTNAYLTSGKQDVYMSLYLPYQLPENTEGTISLYLKIINQPSTAPAVAYGTDSFIYGFNARLSTIAEQTWIQTDNCIYKYIWDATNQTVGAIGEPLGNVKTYVASGKITNNNNEIIYTEGGIVNIGMCFSSIINANFKNNIPVLIAMGHAVGYHFNGDSDKTLHSFINLDS